jgi:hypothetical protein
MDLRRISGDAFAPASDKLKTGLGIRFSHFDDQRPRPSTSPKPLGREIAWQIGVAMRNPGFDADRGDRKHRHQ